VTAVEVVQTFIDRILEVNNQITCVVDNRFDDALKEAAKIDSLIKNWDYDEEEIRIRFPLLGVPFTVKDFFSVAGFVNVPTI